MKKYVDGVLMDMTAEDISAREVIENEFKSPEKKLARIKKIRLEKLIETDYMANNDYTMPDDVKNWRQAMRDIPANYTESEYDEILARDLNGNLTHSVWSK